MCIRREETERREAAPAVAEAEADGGEEAEELVETLIDVYNSRLDSTNSHGQMMGSLCYATRGAQHSSSDDSPCFQLLRTPVPVEEFGARNARRPVLLMPASAETAHRHAFDPADSTTASSSSPPTSRRRRSHSASKAWPCHRDPPPYPSHPTPWHP